jgi:hypothetical protein
MEDRILLRGRLRRERRERLEGQYFRGGLAMHRAPVTLQGRPEVLGLGAVDVGLEDLPRQRPRNPLRETAKVGCRRAPRALAAREFAHYSAGSLVARTVLIARDRDQSRGLAAPKSGRGACSDVSTRLMAHKGRS